MTLVDAPRTLCWDGCFNARDLGGVVTADGEPTRRHQIVRSDTLTRLTDSGRNQARAAGVSLVIDLREPSQVARDPHPFQHDQQISYRNIPLVSADFPHPVEPDLCVRALDVAQVQLADIVHAIAHTPHLAVIHCHSGSGRTGVVAIVLLMLAGADRKAIAEDFALSARPGATGPRRDSRPWGAGSNDVATDGLAVIDRLQGHHGGPEAFLRQGGALDADIQAVMERLRPRPAQSS